MIAYRSLYVWLAGISVSSALSAPSPRVPWPAQASHRVHSACRVLAVAVHALTLADGRTLTIDTHSAAYNGTSAFFAGNRIYIWPRNSSKSSLPTDASASTYLGILIDSTQTVTLVPNPLAPRVAVAPRVASDGLGGWHVIFTTGNPGGLTGPAMLDTATVWYGHFEGAKWTELSKIANVSSVYPLETNSSALVVADGTLNWALPFDRSWYLKSNASGNQGVILFRRSGGRWRQDTLRTWAGPFAVRAIARANSDRLTVAIVQDYFEKHRPRHAAVFIATYDRSWTIPRKVAGDGEHGVTDAMIAPLDTGFVLGWKTTENAGAEGGMLSWVVFSGPEDTGAEVHDMGPLNPLDWPILRVLDSTTVIWLTRAHASRDSVDFLAIRNRTTRDIGAIRLPLDNFGPEAVVLSPTRLLVVTGASGRERERDGPASILSLVRLTCSDPKRDTLGGDRPARAR